MVPILIGMIAPDPASVTGKDEWMAFIRTHPALSVPKPKGGTNPFTKKSTVFAPSPDTAEVVVSGNHVGTIHRARDDARSLIVWAEPEAISPLIAVAEDIAQNLGWTFKRYENA